jgi:cbb3-type cytochrome oxidase maturation protein
MIGASLLIALVFLFAFLWSVRSGQMDDTITPAMRILFEDSVHESSENKSKVESKNQISE